VFLFLSKALSWLFCPLSWTLVLLALALLFHRAQPRRAALLTLAALLVLSVFSTSDVADALQSWVEAGAVSTARAEVTYDTVIILGGMVEPDATMASGEPAYPANAERLMRGFELLQGGWARDAILSAGTLDPTPGALTEATVLDAQLQLWGIDGGRLVAETRSRNTRENALETAKIVRERGYRSLLLVTSAAHMSRALGCFHAVGLYPDAMPVGYRAGRRDRGLLPRSGALDASTDALHELVGRVVYRWAGYSVP
jgi:uncharacterized SAM-binding protein YcdF (DUF218 family)